MIVTPYIRLVFEVGETEYGSRIWKFKMADQSGKKITGYLFLTQFDDVY